MNKELKEMTNIGIPVYNPLEIKTRNMTNQCYDNKNKTEEALKEIKLEAVKKISDITGNKSMNKNINYLRNINFYANDKSTSVFDVDDIERIINIFFELTKLDRKPLGEIKKELLVAEKALIERAKFVYSNRYTKEMHDGLKADYSDIYYGREYDSDLRNYLKNESNNYAGIMNNLGAVLDIDYQSMLEEYTDTLHPEKTSLFIAFQYIKNLREAIIGKDLLKAQEAIFYLTAYQRLHINIGRNMYIEGDCVNNQLIINEVNRSFTELPELRKLNYKRDFFENKPLEDNKQVIDTLLNIKKIKTWESFIKPGKVYRYPSTSPVPRKRSIESPYAKEAIDELLALREYIYLKNKPIAQIEGIGWFSNYKAFVYENGMVPADRFEGIYNFESLKKDAIYVFDANNFEDMIHLTKQELMYLVPRIYHTEKWHEKVSELVTKETPMDLHIAAKCLARKK